MVFTTIRKKQFNLNVIEAEIISSNAITPKRDRVSQISLITSNYFTQCSAVAIFRIKSSMIINKAQEAEIVNGGSFTLFQLVVLRDPVYGLKLSSEK